MHVILWEFEPKQGKSEEFERTYGPGGDWAWLFARSPDYRGSDLLRPLADGLYTPSIAGCRLPRTMRFVNGGWRNTQPWTSAARR